MLQLLKTLGVTCVAFLVTCPARSDTVLPEASYFGFAKVEIKEGSATLAYDSSTGMPGTLAAAANSAFGTGSGNSFVSAAPSPIPTFSLSLAATSTGAIRSSALGVATMTYSFEILGADGLVPVQVNASGGASMNFNVKGSFEYGIYASSVGAIFSVKDGAAFNLSHSIFANLAHPTAGFEETGIYMLQTNLPYTVNLGVFGELEAVGTNTSITGSAFADPTFRVALPDGLAENYSIVLSEGVGNGSTVPDNGPDAFWIALTLGLAVFVRKWVSLPTRSLL